MMIRAAVARHRIALARNALAEQDVSEERLLKPFEQERPTRNAYYRIYPPHHEVRTRAEAFKA
jgi:DNA-binding transcriptional LysR family regulator